MLLWYAGYGSNLCRDRFLTYLHGGRAVGAARGHAGARDRSLPLGDQPLRLPGGLHFGGTSTTWGGGGVAFYDPSVPGEVLARAYLVTEEQFADVAAQEMRRQPGPDNHDGAAVAAALSQGRHVGGPGNYETVHRVGEIDGAPVVTFTADVPSLIPTNPPVAAYLQVIARGLRTGHGLGPVEVTDYLMGSPAVGEHWERADVHRLAAAA